MLARAYYMSLGISVSKVVCRCHPGGTHSIDCWTVLRSRRLYAFRSSLEPQYSLWASGLTRVLGSYGGCSSSSASMMASMWT